MAKQGYQQSINDGVREELMIYRTPDIGPEEEAALKAIFDLRHQLRYYVAEHRRWMGLVRRVLSARAIQGSNSIEGFDVSVEDAVAAVEGEEPVEAEAENWNAVRGYRSAMTYVLQLAGDKHFAYNPGLLRSLHFMMTEHSLDVSPGLWRPGPIWVRNDATGELVYEAPEAETVPELIDELIDSLANESECTATVRAAMAHLNLVMIHPFRDGNGRMARCLQTLVLAREGIIAAPFSSIEEYLGANTNRYYDILAQTGQGSWNPANDARPWLRFNLEAHYVQAASVLRRVQESEQIWGSLQRLAEKNRLPERAMAALFDASLGLRVRNSSYRAALTSWGEEISMQVATSDLGTMVKAGLLVPKGMKRGTYYIASNELRATREELLKRRTPIDASHIFEPAA